MQAIQVQGGKFQPLRPEVEVGKRYRARCGEVVRIERVDPGSRFWAATGEAFNGPMLSWHRDGKLWAGSHAQLDSMDLVEIVTGPCAELDRRQRDHLQLLEVFRRVGP